MTAADDFAWFTARTDLAQALAEFAAAVAEADDGERVGWPGPVGGLAEVRERFEAIVGDTNGETE